MDPHALLPGARRNADNSITLCPPCSKSGCCPKISFLEGGGAVISDDEGGVLQSVTFTPEQLALLGQTIMMNAWKGDIAR
jgi:hypothetical protein